MSRRLLADTFEWVLIVAIGLGCIAVAVFEWLP